MNADVAVTDPRVRPITHPPDQSISVHPRSSVAKISCLRRWLRVCGASRGFADPSSLMEAMCWLGVGVGKSARLTVQGINTEWFERRGRAGFCRRLTVQGINTGWFERHGWIGRPCPLRRAIGGSAPSGGVGGKLAVRGAVAGVGHDRDWRHRWDPGSVSNGYGGVSNRSDK